MRSMRLIALLAIPAQFALAQAPSSRGTSLTLDEAIATAQRNNPLFQQVENNLRSASSQVREAYGALLPSVSANYGTTYQQGGTQVDARGTFTNPNSYSSSYSLGLAYTLAPSMVYAPQAARFNRDAAEADITNQAEALRSQVTTQYITAIEQEAQAKVQDTLVESAAGQLDLVNAKAAVGAATVVDIRTAEVALGQAQVAALQAHNSARVAKLTLFQVMGVQADITAKLVTDFPLSTPNFSLDSLISLAHRVNPDVAAKQSRQIASEAQLKVAKSQYLPSVSLRSGYAAQAFGYSSVNGIIATEQQEGAVLTQRQIDSIQASNRPFNFAKTPYAISASISLPIFNNFQREANIEQQRVVRDNAVADVRARNLQLNTDVAQAYYTLIADARAVELQTQIATKSAEELAAAQERYKVGAASFLDVTVANGNYQKSQIDRVTSVYEYHKAFAALENAVGRPLR